MSYSLCSRYIGWLTHFEGQQYEGAQYDESSFSGASTLTCSVVVEIRVSSDASGDGESNDDTDVVNPNAGEYESPQKIPDAAVPRPDVGEFLDPMTTKTALWNALMLTIFGIISVSLSLVLGVSLSLQTILAALTSPLQSLSVSGVLFQYSMFLFVSALVTPLSVYLLLRAGVSLQKPNMAAVKEGLPVPLTVYVTVIGALEEVVFRLLPLVIATFLFGDSTVVVFGALVVGTIPWLFAHTSGQYPNTAIFGVFFILLWAGGYGVAAIVVHAAHNFFAATVALFLRDDEQSEGS